MARRFNKTDAVYMNALSSRYGLPAATNFPCFVSLRFKVSSTSGINEILCWNDNSDAQWRRIYTSNTTLYIAHKGYDNPTPVNINLGTISVNTWHHVWAYFGSTTNFRGQLDNNTEQNYAGYTGEFNSFTQLNVGNRASGQVGMNGDIAEIGVWDRNLESDLKSKLVAGVPPWLISPDDLIGYYPMWGAYDISGTGAIEQNCTGDPIHYLQSTDTDPSKTPQSPHSPTIPAFTWFSGIPFTQDADQEITVSSINSAESFGSASLQYDIDTDGTPTAESFGLSELVLNVDVNTYGIASSEDFGTIIISKEQELVAEDIESLEAFGSHFVNRGSVDITTFSIFTEENFGSATITPEQLNITFGGIPSEEAFGSVEIIEILKPVSITSAEVFGNTAVEPNSVFITPDGISSEEAFGASVVSTGIVLVNPISIISEEVFGLSSLTTGNVDVSVNSIGSSEVFGNTSLTPGIENISAPPINSTETFGSTTVVAGTVFITPAGIQGQEAFGDFQTTGGTINITIDPISTEEAFGSHTFTTGNVDLFSDSIQSQENFGSFNISAGTISIVPASISSDESFGSTNVSYNIDLQSINSEEDFGTITFDTGAVDITIESINSEESFGSVIVRNLWELVVPSISSLEAIGSISIAPFIQNDFMDLMDEDLDDIMDEEDEFSIPALYKYKEGSDEPISVIFDNEYVEVNTDTEASIISRQPMIGCKDRFKRRPTRGDKVIIKKVNYSVLTYEPDGTGWATITLQHERTTR